LPRTLTAYYIESGVLVKACYYNFFTKSIFPKSKKYSTLPLLVFFVSTNDEQHALTTDYFAVAADPFN